MGPHTKPHVPHERPQRRPHRNGPRSQRSLPAVWELRLSARPRTAKHSQQGVDTCLDLLVRWDTDVAADDRRQGRDECKFSACFRVRGLRALPARAARGLLLRQLEEVRQRGHQAALEEEARKPKTLPKSSDMQGSSAARKDGLRARGVSPQGGRQECFIDSGGRGVHLSPNGRKDAGPKDMPSVLLFRPLEDAFTARRDGKEIIDAKALPTARVWRPKILPCRGCGSRPTHCNMF